MSLGNPWQDPSLAQSPQASSWRYFGRRCSRTLHVREMLGERLQRSSDLDTVRHQGDRCQGIPANISEMEQLEVWARGSVAVRTYSCVFSIGQSLIAWGELPGLFLAVAIITPHRNGTSLVSAGRLHTQWELKKTPFLTIKNDQLGLIAKCTQLQRTQVKMSLRNSSGMPWFVNLTNPSLLR